MRRILIFTGVLIVMAGLFWPWLSRIPLGRLPGDIIIDRPDFKFVFPLTTMVLISVFISLLLWLVKKW